MNLNDVPRNDFDAAKAYYEANKPISEDAYGVLASLQDSGRAFFERTKDWEVTPTKRPWEE